MGLSIALIGGCGMDAKSGGRGKPQVQMGVRNLDKGDAEHVYEWALGACRDAPLTELGRQLKLGSQTRGIDCRHRIGVSGEHC